MITLEKLLTELKGESLNEIVAGKKWRKKTSTYKHYSSSSSTSTYKKTSTYYHKKKCIVKVPV